MATKAKFEHPEFDEDAPIDDDDNPEWTEEDFANALPASSLPQHVLDVFPATKAAVEAERRREAVVVRLDPELIAKLKTRLDWEPYVNDTLRRAVGL